MRLNRKLCYLHFPKTAGTALATQLVPLLGDRLAVAQWQQAECDLDEFDWVHGHLYWDQIQRNFSSTPYLMTMLRHPIERVLSLYRFIGRKPDLGMHEKVKNMTFDEFVESRIGSNVYVNQLTGVVIGDGSDATIKAPGTPEARIDLALRRLDSFDFIGIAEQFSYSTLLLCRDLGIEPMWKLSQANSAPKPTVRADIEPDTLAALKRYAGADIRIYERALELFKARVSKLIGVLP